MAFGIPAQVGSDGLGEELLQLLARQGRRLPVPVFLAALMIAWLSRTGASADPMLGMWLMLVGAVLALRALILGRLPTQVQLSTRRRLEIAVALSALNGLTHCLPLLFFPAPTELELAVQSFLLVGLCAGSVATTAGYRPVFLAYLLPVVAALVARWILGSGGAPFGQAIAAIIVVFGAVLVALAGDSFGLFRESFEIRLQQVTLNQRLRAALAQAESANRAKTRFLASASHDLRQPIHTLSLFAAALALRPLDATSRDISEHINGALHNLSGQLDALLDVSKLDAGVVPVRPVSIRMSRFLQGVRAQFHPRAVEQGLTLTVHAHDDVAICTDDVLLGRIVGNLLDNAFKYTERGAVSLTVMARAGQVFLIVEDTGPGIPEAEHARIFEEFYQLDNPERNRAKGLGLGLSIVRRLADLLGARMEMVSVAGAGTSFYLVFEQEDAGAAPAPPAERTIDSLGARHVLVVDDEAAVRHGMQALLQAMGARVTLADGVEQAVRAATEEAPDLLLVDFRLRGDDDGIAVVQAVRLLCPGMPAILISGDTSPERLREAREAQLPLLHKPVPAALLQQAVAGLSAFPTR